jgi:FkbM family methyltransferase
VIELDALRRSGIWIFGAGAFARETARAFRLHGVFVHGFCTSSLSGLADFDGRPVLRLTPNGLAAIAGAALVVGVFNREVASDYGNLATLFRSFGVSMPVLWPQQFYDLFSDTLGFCYWLQPRNSYAAEADAISHARALLDGEASRRAFDALVAFRCDDESHAKPPSPDRDLQYLPTWLDEELSARGLEALNIIDAGAYRGETLRALAERHSIAQAWTFEPDPTNYSALLQALGDWPGPITHMPAAVGELSGSILFSADAGEASHVMPTSDGMTSRYVPVVAIDEALHAAQVDLIKFDVEGHELQALRGCRQTLRRCRPALAVAVYHRWNDLWVLPTYLNSLQLGYRFRIGLHGCNSFDAVLYAY